MALYAEAKEQFTLVPPGQFQVVCCELLDEGFKDRTFKNDKTGADESKKQREIRYIFQLNKINEETGKRFEIRTQPFNLILSEKASLRKFLASWRGHDLLEAELRPPGLDVEGLVGRNAVVSIIHKKEGDKTFANISSIMPLMEGMPTIQPENYQSKQEFVNQAAAGVGNAANGANLNQARQNYQPPVDSITQPPPNFQPPINQPNGQVAPPNDDDIPF